MAFSSSGRWCAMAGAAGEGVAGTATWVDASARPSGTGCVECEATGGWWFHLRRCALCGHVGCCDASPSQHARGHFAESGHPVARSFEPGEAWFWNYATGEFVTLEELAPPPSRPLD